ncbi:MAG: hypothetical protein CL760_01130 [Chloroflexi bacterium]|nr:hypothetical protein [Chloroflexota bacterium]|tara:strand:- start:3124 stop:3960 length:837 start_codon:yes stop_codon:yes gene_type:complete
MEILKNLNEIEKKLNHFKNEKNKLQKEKANYSNKEKSDLAESEFVFNIFLLFIGLFFSSSLLGLQNYSNSLHFSGIAIFITSFISFFSVSNCLNLFILNHRNKQINYSYSIKFEYPFVIISLGFSFFSVIVFLLHSFHYVVDISQFSSQFSIVIYSIFAVCFLLHIVSFVFKNLFIIGNVNYINPDKYKDIERQKSLIIEEEKKYIKKTKQNILQSCSNFGRFELLEEQINKNKAPLLYSLFITSREEYAKKLGFNDFASFRINELEKIATMEIIETS